MKRKTTCKRVSPEGGEPNVFECGDGSVVEMESHHFDNVDTISMTDTDEGIYLEPKPGQKVIKTKRKTLRRGMY